MQFDPTLQINNNQAPGMGVQGKTLGVSESGWGHPSEKAADQSFSQVDFSENNVQINTDNFENFSENNVQINTDNFENFSENNVQITNEDPTLLPPIQVPIYDAPIESLKPKKNKNADHELMEFYDKPSDLLTEEDRSIVNPKELAQKLLAKVEYNEQYGVDMLEYFLTKERYRTTMDIHYRKDGEMREFERHIANAPPMFSEFGRRIGVSERTLKAWAKKHPMFQEAFEICQDIIQEFFVENGVKGDYASQFSIFAAKNLTKMKDVIVNKNENYDIKAVLDSIEKGKIIDIE